MKQIVFTVILIFAFCFTAFADSPLDSYGKISWKDETARLDSLAVELYRNKDFNAVIFLDFDKKIFNKSAKNRLRKIFSHLFEKRKIEKRRVTFVIAEKTDEHTIFWLISPSVKLPECDNCQIVKAEDFEQKIKKLFPKN